MLNLWRLLSIPLTILIAFLIRVPLLDGLIASAQNPIVEAQCISHDSISFQLSDNIYLANTRFPKVIFNLESSQWSSVFGQDSIVPFTVFRTNASCISRQTLEDAIESFLLIDDVFSIRYLEAVYLTSAKIESVIEPSALDFLTSLGTKVVLADESISTMTLEASILPVGHLNLPSGPYLATRQRESLALSAVYRLYPDTYQTFQYGTYEVGDGSSRFTTTNVSCLNSQHSMIPVPSRLYSIEDPRPFAGYRVAVKDLFDMKGLITSAGSHALAYIKSPAENTAPSIQRIVDLGGVLVGKQKLAQFGSGANPWDWVDQQHPYNPRGDGWLTCSASSSGGGCAVAAYDWLDFAIGSDTGCSMRRPAAVSGTYGQRPSQGTISLENVIPLGGATDTAGVFCRDPRKWAEFSKIWYTPELNESPERTGLSPLSMPDTYNYPRTILYPIDYLPLSNPMAQSIVDDFITNLTIAFGMQVKHINFTETVQEASDSSVADVSARNRDILDIIDYHPHWEEVASPLINTWAKWHNGSFPPIDPAYREPWMTWNITGSTMTQYSDALHLKRRSVDWYEQNLQYSSADLCSESVLLYDIGTGGLPSYREKNLNAAPNASFLALAPEGTVMNGAGICPLYGCVDFTIPIGQVSYWSPITRRDEMMPVTINMVAKRGCDFMLYNMVDALAEKGVLRTMKPGKTMY